MAVSTGVNVQYTQVIRTDPKTYGKKHTPFLRRPHYRGIGARLSVDEARSLARVGPRVPPSLELLMVSKEYSCTFYTFRAQGYSIGDTAVFFRRYDKSIVQVAEPQHHRKVKHQLHVVLFKFKNKKNTRRNAGERRPQETALLGWDIALVFWCIFRAEVGSQKS